MSPPRGFSKRLDAAGGHVWRLITDTRSWPHWGPSVRAVDCGDRFIHAGSSGRILTPIGIWVPFSAETFDPGRYWDWRVGGLAATGHRVAPIGPNRCRLTFTVPAWAFGYGLVCRLALNRIDRWLAQAGNRYGG
ncbi:hypothetical protein DSCA_58780 [Desulfosarcina alkanivorans]|uniref:Polyketide cyclase n=1 Tax=Desulfosarcina alkanivorans TaxID=571177 RepID=A0A5K7YTI4_9BACT|nr:SRPBCC family protein [Desulfosarcina alkanivorans]BBO71948.1 hypothetical protein DSCA_58780 [Desulfosarcina alkanivorans]